MRFAALTVGMAGSSVLSSRAGVPFIAGADFSDVTYFQSLGVIYQDDGQPQTEPLEILKKHGVTCIRLRLWTSSAQEA